MEAASKDDLLVPGKVVRLRERLWRVDHRAGATFGATALDGRDNTPTRFSVVLEDVQPGALPMPSPDAVGDEREQRLLLDAYRFSLLHGTAPILGLQRSRAIPTDFQMVPLLMALENEKVRLLIADDVGTGKTIEAGLILSELLARGRARRILVCVPANLRDQWSDTLDQMFHIDATVVAGHLLPSLERRLLPGQSIWAAHDVIIASIDYLKTRTEEVLSHPWDLVLVDEAHLAAAPHAFAGRMGNDMERHAFVRNAAQRTRHLLLLTATPHNGYSDSYQSLFRMLDPDLVADSPSGPRLDRTRARDRHVVQRRRADIEAWYSERDVPSPFPTRDSDEIIVSLSRAKDMKALLEGLNGYTGELYESATSSIGKWVAAHLHKRLLSSPAALRISLDKRLNVVTREAAIDLGEQAERTAAEATTDALFTEDDEHDAAHLLARVPMSSEREITYLKDLRQLAAKVTAAKDPKLTALLRLLPTRMAAHPAAQRVIVFTKFKDTLDYLEKNLVRAVGKAKDGLPDGTEVFTIYGDMNLAQRNETFAQFEAADKAVLIATDCISEGVNLQRACAELVHYELPWNPNRIEQRNGRIDRFHQREPSVGIRTLVLDDPLDASLLHLIVQKSEKIRTAYGFVPPFLANSDILLHLSDPGTAFRAKLQSAPSLQPTLFSDDAMQETDAELARLTDESIADTETLERVKDESFYGQTGISLTAIEQALTESREVTGTSEQIEQFALAALRQRHGSVTTKAGIHTMTNPARAVADLAPEGHRFTFDPLTGVDDPTLDVVDLAHPLLRRLVDLTLDDARLPDCRGRVAAKVVQTDTGRAVIHHVLFRYVANADPPVLLEELLPLAFHAGDGNPLDANAALSASAGQGTVYAGDVRADAAAALADPDLEAHLTATANQRASDLASRHAELTAAWADGLTDVRPTSRDLVALTLHYPEVTA